MCNMQEIEAQVLYELDQLPTTYSAGHCSEDARINLKFLMQLLDEVLRNLAVVESGIAD